MTSTQLSPQADPGTVGDGTSDVTNPFASAPFGLLVSPSWLQAHLDDSNLTVLDCTAYLDDSLDPATGPSRARSEFRQSHIPRAKFVDLEREFSDPTHPVRFMAPGPEQLSEALQRLDIGANTRLVVYSRGEMWTATRIWWVLRLYGFDRCSVLDGGWTLWNLEARPTASGEDAFRSPHRPVGWQPFTPLKRIALIADRHDVLRSIEKRNAALTNARLPPFFLGEGGNVYGRRGHIVGSVNVPAAFHLDTQTQRFLPVANLRAQFDKVLAPGCEVIAYCGYGLAASGTVFSLALLGREGVRLYDGSLAEWAADPCLPMASEPTDTGREESDGTESRS